MPSVHRTSNVCVPNEARAGKDRGKKTRNSPHRKDPCRAEPFLAPAGHGRVDYLQIAGATLPNASVHARALALPSSLPHNGSLPMPEVSLQGQLMLGRVGLHAMDGMRGWVTDKLQKLKSADELFTRALMPSGAEAKGDRERICVTPEDGDVVCVAKKGARRSDETCFTLARGEQLCAEVVPVARRGRAEKSKPVHGEDASNAGNDRSQKASFSLLTGDRDWIFLAKAGLPTKKQGWAMLAQTALSGFIIGYMARKAYQLYRWFNPKWEPLIKHPENEYW